MSFENLDNSRMRGIKNGDTTTPIKLTLNGYTPSSGNRSGRVPDGIYECTCYKAEWRVTDKGDARFLSYWRTSAPAPHVGIPIRQSSPAPVDRADGSPPSPGNVAFWQAMATSITQHSGAFEQFQAAQEFEMTPAAFVGKSAYIRLEQQEGSNGKVYSEVKWFVTRAEFEENPGPELDVGVQEEGNNGTDAAALATANVRRAPTASSPEIASPGAGAVNEMLNPQTQSPPAGGGTGLAL